MKVKAIAFGLLLLMAIALPIESACQRTKKETSYRNPAGDEFPVLAWVDLAAEKNRTKAGLLEIHDAGINIATGSFKNRNHFLSMLHEADGTGVRFLVADGELWHLETVKRGVDVYKNIPTVAGYLLCDEPNADRFKELRSLKEEIQKYDPNRLVFVNLFPIYASSTKIGTGTYLEYLNEFADILQLPILSYDNYPITFDKGKYNLRADYYENFELARRVASDHGMVLWTYVLSSAHRNYPIPTKGEMLLQMNSGLAYGAQGIEYFCYSPFGTNGKEEVKNGSPINEAGERTNVWFAMQANNRQLQARKSVHLGATVNGVWHTGSKIPQGTQRLSAAFLPDKFNRVNSKGDGVIVSWLTNADMDYLMIVNRNFLKSQKVEVSHEEGVMQIDAKGNLISSKSKTIKIAPGDCIIYAWKK